MDKISAACAMEWSIQLDKALRSNNPARAGEAILQTGQRLELWGREPEATKAVCSIFGLVPGEDRLFANTILLRLADAFRFGDKKIRLSIVRIFLTNIRCDKSSKHRKQKRRTFLNSRVNNHEELLRRVKIVLDTGDVESRAMALVLFGCWADFAKDSAEIRYLVLSSMVSSDILETGVKLVSDSSEENFIIAMLVSLSKLVSKSTSLISEQVDVLLRCVTQENSLQIRVTALRCLHLIFVKEGCCSPGNTYAIKALFSLLDELELPSVMHWRALQILHKILLYTIPGLSSLEKLEFAQILAILQNASLSPIMSKSLAALRILTDMSTILWARTNSESFAVYSSPLPLQVISLVMAQVRSLVKPSSDTCQTSNRILQKVKNLLNLILQLVGEHLDLGVTVLGEISSFIKYFANLNENALASKHIASGEVIDFEEDMGKVFRSKLLSDIHRFVSACLQILSEAGAITASVFDKVQLLVEHLHHGRVFDYYTRTIYSLLLHSRPVGILNEHPFKQELATLEHACKMMSARDNWYAYKAGIYATSQGAWVTATFIFTQLIKRVQSDSCYCWLKSLVQFSHSEAKLWLSSLAKQESFLVGSVVMNELLTFLKDNFGELGQDAAGNDSVLNYRDILVGAYHNACSSIETLERLVISQKAFCFQRWFFSLRTKFLWAVGEILEVLDASKQEIFSNMIEVQNNALTNVKCLEKFTHFSFRLNRLAKELDLINSSFIGMESESLKVIATLALSCSVLAFSTGFPVFFPNIPAHKNLRTRDQEDAEHSNLSSMLLQDLLGRLLHIDQEISMDLCLLLESGGYPRKCFHLQSRNCIPKSGHEVEDILNITRYAVSTVIRLRNEINGIENEAIISQVTKNGREVLLDIIRKWLRIPFQMPKHFFNTRPFIGSELFVFSTYTRNQNQIVVLSGSHLSLNLCLQLRNASPGFSLKLTKLYCLLHSRVSSPKPSHREGNNEETETESNRQPWKREDMVEMNEKLFRYVTEREKKTSHGKRFRDSDTKDEQIANEFVCFEPNGKGQGFSSCVLDVSHFPVGSYRIEWYSCCIDSEGSYWTLLPFNTEPLFTVQQSHVIAEV
ncbi:ARM repeat superfamily protein, putative isoform 3 [Hibiscus syriacus]|uniref:ARM repeat superfamily protein, putative isoform 3 n=1 Tax=Hibiscus syriacus TaxID=106335 RepID=A0A6A3CFE9_HIBSY|nr:ARM repeat superfamily protein, putative isoform 3 [Hibiscus syriacus]